MFHLEFVLQKSNLQMSKEWKCITTTDMYLCCFNPSYWAIKYYRVLTKLTEILLYFELSTYFVTYSMNKKMHFHI
jgi:hypothetical protein